MRWWKDESGQALVMTVVSMGVLLGFLALAADVGNLFRVKRNLQIVADAAATAGALDYYYTVSNSSASTAATKAANANGVVDGTSGGLTTTITVIPAPPSGAHTGNGYVEVDILQQQRTTLMNYFGFNNVGVFAKAVAGQVQNQGCIYLMGSGNGLTAQGSALLTGWDPVAKKRVKGCGVYVANDVGITGASNTFDVAYVAASGTLSGNKDTNPAPVIQNAPTEQVPTALRNLTPPSPSSFSSCNPPSGYTTSTSGKGKKAVTVVTATLTGTITPPSGGQCYGLGSTGADHMDLTIDSATLKSGLYVFDLGTNGILTVGSNISGTGVTLDINTGDFTVSASSSNVNLYAPNDGALDPYNGIGILEPATNTGNITIQWGSATGNFAGIIDAPGATATMQDSGGSSFVTGLVLGHLNMKNSQLYVENYGSIYTGSPLNSIALVQ